MQHEANGKKTRKSYSPKYKKTAVNAALLGGIRPTARDLGIPSTTLRNWVNKQVRQKDGAQKNEPIFDHTGDAIEELTVKLRKIANLSADRVIRYLEGHVTISAEGKIMFQLRELSTVLGISTDKLIALGGNVGKSNNDGFDVHVTIGKGK